MSLSITWYPITLPLPGGSTLPNYQSIAYGNGIFVAVGGPICAWSSDARTWNSVTLPVGGAVAIIFDGTQFVVTCSGLPSYSCLSTDAVTWTSHVLSDTSEEFTSIAYSGSVYVAVGAYVGTIAYSSDAKTWTNSSVYRSGNVMYDVAYGGGNFVVPISGTSTAYYSAAGATWTLDSTLPASGAWNSISYFAPSSKFFMAARTTTTSVNGVPGTWSSVTLPASGNWYGSESINGYAVLLDYSSATSLSSTDLATWSSLSMSSSHNWMDIAYGATDYVTVGFDSSADALTSVPPPSANRIVMII